MPILVATADGREVPLGPVLSLFDPVFIAVDEFGHTVSVSLMYRNLLAGAEPGGGKSNLLNLCAAHGVLDPRCDLVLLDAKQVEMGQWAALSKKFVGPDQAEAIVTLQRLQIMMDRRYAFLTKMGLRKIKRHHGMRPVLLLIDEIAWFSATVGKRQDQELFSVLLRDIVARGRAVGLIVVCATQRPSHDIIPTSLRDLFAWRFAGRCTTDASSDIVLGHGWANKGWSANTISPNNPGAGLLIAEDGVPKMVKTAYLSDADCANIATYAATMRHLVAAGELRVAPGPGETWQVPDAA